jgi:uncharacterized membrane protein YhaH (DUF805 family)
MATTEFQPPTARRRRSRFYVGIAWALIVAAIASRSMQVSFLSAFFVFLLGMIITASLALAWLTLWAQRDDSLPGQFTIGSLLFATCFISIFCAAVRWVGARSLELHPQRTSEGLIYLPVAIGCGLVGLITMPIAFGMLDSMLRAAIWSLKRPLVRSGLKRMLSRD